MNEKKQSATPRGVLLLGALLTLSILFIVVYPPNPVKDLEHAGYDEMVRFLSGNLPSPDVAVVDVDEESLSKLGQWPWPRYRIAALVEQASALGARSVALDFFFSEPDRTSLGEISDLYRRERGINLDLSGVPETALDNDQILATVAAQNKVVFGADLRFDEATPNAAASCGKPFQVVLRAMPGANGTPQVPVAVGMVCPVPALADAATFVAATNTIRDRDGKLRRAPLVMRSAGETWVPSLSMGALLAASDDDQVTVTWSAAGISDVRVGQTVIPTDYQGNMLLPYRAKPTDRFRRISAIDLLQGRVARNLLEGKIVFIGASASGLQDVHATPIMRACPGVYLHALAVDAILRKDFLMEPAWSRGLQASIVLLSGILVTLLVAWTRVSVSVVVTAGTIAALIFGSWAMFDRWGMYWSPFPGAIMLASGISLLSFVRFRHEEKRKQLLRQSFERYVSAEIVKQIVQGSRPVNVSGERRMVTILMSDIRGFTSMSEVMPPEDLVRFLNSYFAAMIDIILANEGTLDKFMGDAVLALFGAPVQHDDDSLRAVRVALGMQEKLRELNAQWVREGMPKIRVGIGISTGEVIVGNIGSARRLEYTAIGQHVNYAQRIESLTKDLQSDILVSETAFEQIKDYVDAERFGPITIKGKTTPIFVYGITGLKRSSL